MIKYCKELLVFINVIYIGKYSKPFNMSKVFLYLYHLFIWKWIFSRKVTYLVEMVRPCKVENLIRFQNIIQSNVSLAWLYCPWTVTVINVFKFFTSPLLNTHKVSLEDSFEPLQLAFHRSSTYLWLKLLWKLQFTDVYRKNISNEWINSCWNKLYSTAFVEFE